jgi:kumamolisin
VTGHSSGGPTQVEYESSDINVIGVGGTTLNLAPDGTVQSERGWVGSGGGKSGRFTRQIWQKGAGMPAGNERLVPDVSLAADPNTGACVILHGQRQQIGGTSWRTPCWAGFCALIHEARGKAGKSSPHLPAAKTFIRCWAAAVFATSRPAATARSIPARIRHGHRYRRAQ